MPIISQIICDGCQAVKKQTNHWYTLVFTEEHQACLRPMAMTLIHHVGPDVHGTALLLWATLCPRSLRTLDG